jgi:hypothetical protein
MLRQKPSKLVACDLKSTATHESGDILTYGHGAAEMQVYDTRSLAAAIRDLRTKSNEVRLNLRGRQEEDE